MSRITHYPTLIITNIKMNCVFLIILDHTINVYIEIRSYQLWNTQIWGAKEIGHFYFGGQTIHSYGTVRLNHDII